MLYFKKAFISSLFLFLNIILFGQSHTETFESGFTRGDSIFESNGVSFELGGSWYIENVTDYGKGKSNWYVDHSAHCPIAGEVGTINTADGSSIYINNVWVYTSNTCAAYTSGSIIINWYNDGVNLYTDTVVVDVDSDPNILSNGFFFIDFDDSLISCLPTDEMRFEILGDLTYLAIDNFTWSTNTSQTLLDTSVVQSDDTLRANFLNANYQWLDCNDMNLPIGITSSELKATETGSYAVEISKGDCIDTSSCYEITYIVGLFDIKSNSTVQLFPNPSKDQLKITSDNESAEKIEVVIYNIDGDKVMGLNGIKYDEYIDISSLTSGIYYLLINEENESVRLKFVKE